MLLLVLVPAESKNTKNINGGITASGTVEGFATDEATTVVATGTIQDAIAASTDNTASIVQLLRKTYYENVDVDKSLQLIGMGPKATKVSGDTDGDRVGNGRVFTIYQDKTVTLQGMTIKNGDADYDTYNPTSEGYYVGGGILNDRGTLTVINCDINNNHAGDYGGGIENLGGVLTVSNSNIHDNIAGTYGGGVENYDYWGTGGVTATLTDSRIHHNTAIDGYGGGVDNYYGVMDLDNCQIDHNLAGKGGGVYDYWGTSTIDGSEIVYNTASYSEEMQVSGYGAYGGGIYTEGTTSTITNSKIANNAAIGSITAAYGGGIYDYYSTLAITGSTLSGNKATNDGGAIYAQTHSSTGETLTVENSQLTANRAGDNGGGIYWLDTNGVPPTLTDDTFKRNTPNDVYPAIP